MTIEGVVVGAVGTNCYVISDKSDGVAAIVDPGGEPETIMGLVDRLRVEIAYVINTHGHVDHIGANHTVKEKTKAVLMIHRLDADMLSSSVMNLSALSGCELVSPPADRIMEDGDTIMFGGVKLEIAHTPGHSPGSVCLMGDGFVFSGDTLFFDSIGRTDLPGGSYQDIMDSIRNILSPLPDEVMVYPGHGPSGKMGEVRMVNPFLA